MQQLPEINPANPRRWKIFSLVFAAVIFAALAIFALQIYPRLRASEYRTYASPDGKFKVVVYRIPQLISLPGQSSDAPGFVRLFDGNGKILGKADLEMVQLVERVEWSSNSVSIPLIAEWKLPQQQ